jgi:hypothetical protein
VEIPQQCAGILQLLALSLTEEVQLLTEVYQLLMVGETQPMTEVEQQLALVEALLPLSEVKQQLTVEETQLRPVAEPSLAKTLQMVVTRL